jgi:lipopolysaccharide export system protein LptA
VEIVRYTMRAILPALLLLSPALHAEEAPAAPRKKIPAVSLLPNGSKLHGVMLPRYDDEQRLSAVLKADVMTLVSDQVIAGDHVTLAFYNTDQSPRARVVMDNAMLDQATGLLEAGGGVKLRGDRIEADGTGLIYQMDKAKGFLAGPVETRIRANTETTMNRSHTRPAVALVGAAMLTVASAERPAALTEAEKSAIAADAKPAAPAHAKAVEAARASLRAELAAAAEATQAAAAFLEEAGVAANGADEPAIPPPAEPLKVEPGPEDTVVKCDGGMYFDADAGLFVYLKNVRVNDPRFELSGANELKIFLTKKPESPDKKEEKKSAFGSGFGDVDRIVATGAVRILHKKPEPGKAPVEASGAIFTYHPESGEIVLTGGFPWVKQGTTFMRAKEPQLSLRIWKSGSFITEGNWDMGGRLNQNP